MGLKATIAKGVRAGFAALGDVKEDVTYKVQGVGIYNTTTGSWTRVETSFTVSGVVMEYKKEEIDGVVIKPNDMQFLFLQESLSTKPKVNDRLLRADGKHWEVMAMTEDPAHVIWILNIRTQNG